MRLEAALLDARRGQKHSGVHRRVCEDAVQQLHRLVADPGRHADGARAGRHRADEAGLLLELAQRRLLRALAGIDQARRQLDRHPADGWAELPHQQKPHVAKGRQGTVG